MNSGVFPRGRTLLLAAAVLLPFAVRACYAIEVAAEPYLQWNMLVAFVNHDFAADMASGRGAPWVLHRSPWYPFAVSLLYRLAGIDPWNVRVVQWLLGAGGCVLMFLFARTHLGRGEAWCALGIGAVYAPSIFFEGEILEQGIASFLILSGALCLGSLRHPAAGPRRAFAAALLQGAGVLMRPEMILATPILAAAAWRLPARRGGGVRAGAVFLIGSALMTVPLLRPGLVIPVARDHTAINAAINLYIGNNPRATGHDAVIPEAPEAPTVLPEARRDHMTGTDLAGIRHARAITGGDLDAVAPFYVRRAIGFVREDPIGWIALEGRKALAFLGGFVTSTQKHPWFAREFSTTLTLLLFCAGICVPLGIVIPAAVASAAAPLPGGVRPLLLAAPSGALVASLVFFHDGRLQQVAAPFLILLAAHGLVGLAGAVRRRRWTGAILFGAMILISNLDLAGTHADPRPTGWFRVGIMHQDRGALAAAAEAYTRAVEADPGHVPAIDNLVAIAPAAGRGTETAALLRRLDDEGRNVPLVSLRRAALLSALARGDEAVAVLERAHARAPDDTDVLRLLGDVQGALGRTGAQEETYRRLLALDPDDAATVLRLVALSVARGDYEEALALARRAGTLGHPAAADLIRSLEEARTPRQR